MMDALTEVSNEETRLHDTSLLQSATVLAARSLTGHSSSVQPTAPVPLPSPLVVPPAAHGESVVFTVIIVVTMDMWRHYATRRRKLRRLRLAVLHRVLVVLIQRI
jgi:hypothetical protein